MTIYDRIFSSSFCTSVLDYLITANVSSTRSGLEGSYYELTSQSKVGIVTAGPKEIAFWRWMLDPFNTLFSNSNMLRNNIFVLLLWICSKYFLYFFLFLFIWIMFVMLWKKIVLLLLICNRSKYLFYFFSFASWLVMGAVLFFKGHST